jgi:hypothetical protein
MKTSEYLSRVHSKPVPAFERLRQLVSSYTSQPNSYHASATIDPHGLIALYHASKRATQLGMLSSTLKSQLIFIFASLSLPIDDPIPSFAHLHTVARREQLAARSYWGVVEEIVRDKAHREKLKPIDHFWVMKMYLAKLPTDVNCA